MVFFFKSQWFLSQRQLTYLYHLELPLTVLQNYRIRAYMILWLSPLKHQKVKKKQNNNNTNNNSKKEKKSIIDILIGYIIGRVYQDSQFPALSVPKGSKRFEILLVKIFTLKQNQILSATIKKIKSLLF